MVESDAWGKNTLHLEVSHMRKTLFLAICLWGSTALAGGGTPPEQHTLPQTTIVLEDSRDKESSLPGEGVIVALIAAAGVVVSAWLTTRYNRKG